MKKFVLVPIVLLAITMHLHGALSAGAGALRRAGQQFVPQAQRFTPTAQRAGMATFRTTTSPRLLSRQSLLSPALTPAAQQSFMRVCPAGMQQRYMASFWENPFTYSKRQAAEEATREEMRARQKAEDALREEKHRRQQASANSMRNVAYYLFGLKQQEQVKWGKDSYVELLEKLGSELGTPKGRKLLLAVMQRDPEDYSVESVANLLTYPSVAGKWLITPDGITLLSTLVSKNADVVRDKLSSLNYGTLYQILDAQGPAITDLAINNPTLDRAFEGYIKNAIKESAVGYKYYENPFVAEFLTRNPQIAIMSAGDINNDVFNRISDKPIAKPLFGAILNSPEASKILAKNVGWTKLEDWREANMPEQLALPETEQLALPPASEEVAGRVDINE